MSKNEFIKILKSCNDKLTFQQFKTLRGQALKGDIEGAYRGLNRILEVNFKNNNKYIKRGWCERCKGAG
ncbi:hypothetical protein HMPREF9998_01726 [Peptostreptococcus anaerobius VPI 4330 = DSM 2949]|nr:hypothetical protein HMPREF9998_01726 [Peptostreptococcus anaerobius VPI 4330 = DSM 2949]